MLGTTFGPYRIEALLGRGGMGEVYRAHDVERDRQVALKVLPPHLAEDAEYQERFRRECRAAARLNEPHIVPIHTFGEIDGRLFLDMRLVEGTDLASWLKTYGAMPPEAAVSVVSQVAAALDAAHAAGLVHRDVKPSNVLLAGVHGGIVDREVFAYLFDFGIARAQEGMSDDPALTRAGTMPGSLAYVAPERFAGVEGDPRADVYALACVLHQALTGKPPFEGDLATLMRAHLNAPPPRPSTTRPDLPTGLDQVVAHGMAKEPANRPASAGALATSARNEIAGLRSSPDAAPLTAPLPKVNPVAAPGWTSVPRQPAPAGWGQAPPPAYGQPGWSPPPQQPGWSSHPSHPAHPYPPQQRPASPNRLVFAVIGVFAVIALVAGGIIVALLAGDEDGGTGGGSTTAALPTTTPAATTTVPPTTAAGNAAENARLLAELPAGYGTANCEPGAPDGAVATVSCEGPPTTDTGPTGGSFTRYSSVADMDGAFDALVAEVGIPAEVGRIEDCDVAGGTKRARYSRQSGSAGGQLACYTDDAGVAYLIWTDETAVAIGYVNQGSGDTPALFGWWNRVDFQVER